MRATRMNQSSPFDTEGRLGCMHTCTCTRKHLNIGLDPVPFVSQAQVGAIRTRSCRSHTIGEYDDIIRDREAMREATTSNILNILFNAYQLLTLP